MSDEKTYHLERIVDLLQVPSDRREQCVKELLLCLEFGEFAEAQWQGPFEWTDDGDASCSITDEDGNAQLTLEVRSV